MRKLLLLVGCLIGAALLISACGSSESDEDQITEVIETSAMSTDPADCEALNTIAFLEQTEFEVEGDEAVEACEENTGDEADENPDSVTVDEIEVDGSSATANASFVGGSLDGQTMTIGLVEEDGDWKVDSFESFAEFDQGKLVAAMEEGLLGSDDVNEEEEELISCFIEEVDSASTEEAEEVVLSQDAFAALFENCE